MSSFATPICRARPVERRAKSSKAHVALLRRGEGTGIAQAEHMDAHSLPLDREFDADDTLRVSLLSPEDLPAEPPREADILGKSTLSFALLTELRTLTPTVHRSASQGPFVVRRSLRSYAALATTSWRRALGLVLRTWVSAQAGAERAIVVARPRAIAWAQVARAVATGLASAARKQARVIASRASAAAVLGARQAVRVGARVHRLAVVHAVAPSAWSFKSSRSGGAARSR
jgi:hypothetical protein